MTHASSLMRPGKYRPKVLVAGINGTLGRVVACKLATAGWAVDGIARGAGEFGEREFLEAAVKNVRVRYGDLCEVAVAEKACTDVEGVVFAAGNSGVIASFADPVGNLLGSVVPWLNVLASCHRGDRLVLLSSQLVYGPPAEDAFREDSVRQPASPYALHRALMEDYGRLFAFRNGYDVTVLRLGNVFGDVVDIDYPRSHGVVPRMLRDVVRDGVAQLYGDGSQRLELLHTEDVAAAVVAVMNAPGVPGSFSVYNLAGESLSVREVAQELCQGVGAGETVCVPWDAAIQQSMAKDMQLCDSAFRDRYGWRPTKDLLAALRAIGSKYRTELPSAGPQSVRRTGP